jgi:GNAT superfamily N-acetyltransferase
VQIAHVVTEPAEIASVRGLFEEYERGLGVSLCFQGFAAELAGLPGRYAPPGGGLWLARCDGSLAGCVGLRSLDAERGEMKRMYVRDAFRRAGVGRRLATQVIAQARAIGLRSLVLDTLASMQAAHALYRDLGFDEIPAYTDNPHPDVRYLGLRLQP